MHAIPHNLSTVSTEQELLVHHSLSDLLEYLCICFFHIRITDAKNFGEILCPYCLIKPSARTKKVGKASADGTFLALGTDGQCVEVGKLA